MSRWCVIALVLASYFFAFACGGAVGRVIQAFSDVEIGCPS